MNCDQYHAKTICATTLKLILIHEGLKGTLMEPALVICWLVIAFVTLYVVIAVITGHPESTFKDEL